MLINISTYFLIHVYCFWLGPNGKTLTASSKVHCQTVSIFPKKKDFKLLDSIESYWNTLTIAATILEGRGVIQAIPSVFWMHNEILFKYYLPNLSDLPLSSLSKLSESAPFLTKSKLSDPPLSSQSQKFLIRSGSEAFEFVSLFFFSIFLKSFLIYLLTPSSNQPMHFLWMTSTFGWALRNDKTKHRSSFFLVCLCKSVRW